MTSSLERRRSSSTLKDGEPSRDEEVRAASPTKRASLLSSGPSRPTTRNSLRLSSSSRLGRPTTSPHSTHAMVLQLQEYHDRLEKALASTYQHALRPPARPATSNGTSESASSSQRPQKPTYARQRVLQTSRACFQVPSVEDTAPPPAFSTPVGVKDVVLPRAVDATIAFHHATPRTTSFLYTENHESRRRMRLIDSMAGSSNSTIVVAKDYFALGPGQYDVRVEKPMGAAIFSPSDRFHEDYCTDRPGPGQYLTSETLVSPRPAAAVFSQLPRQTEIGSIVSPTATVVSSYYYVPDSSFSSSNNNNSAHHLGWSRSARFNSREARRGLLLSSSMSRKQQAPATNFIAKNVRGVRQAAAKYRLQHGGKPPSSHHVHDDNAPSSSPPPASLKRRSLLVASLSDQASAMRPTAASSSRTSTAPPSSAIVGSSSLSPRDRSELRLQSWITITFLATAQSKLLRLRALTSALQRLASMQNHTRKLVTFTAWRTLDAQRHRQYAVRVIIRNSLRYRLWWRIRRKRQHTGILRQFLGGLSFDVRFALAMKRIKRKIQRIQRWWRHVQLMVRAREEALYHKWLAVENRMRLEHINHMPHLQRIFQPPAGTAAAAVAMGSTGMSISAPSTAHASELQLHKLLNLPDQFKWFTARFVLSSDGSVRGYTVDSNEMVVEVKHFRCHYHDVSATGASEGSEARVVAFNSSEPTTLHAYNSYTNAQWKPFLMVFRQGAFRFVVLASPSPLPTEILSWKDKLERLMVTPTGTMLPSISSRDSSVLSFNGSSSDLSFFGSVSDLVEVSMQSGILAPHASDQGHHIHRNSPGRGKFHQRVRSIRQITKSGVSVVDGPLSYYVVDLLKDFPKVPSALVWSTIREKLREKRKAFRAEIYRYKLEMYHYHQHQEHVKHMQVMEKFRNFFTLERPKRPHFRSLISSRKMEALIRQTVEQVKATTPSNPRVLLG